MTDEELYNRVNERQAAATMRDEFDKQVEACTADIKAELIARGVKKLYVGDWAPTVIEMDREGISKTKLLSAGVTVAQIQAAIEITHVTQLRVFPRPENE